MTQQSIVIGKYMRLSLLLVIILSFALLSACSFFSLFGGNQITGAAVVDGAIQEETQEEASQSATEADTLANEETSSLEDDSSSGTGSPAVAVEASSTTTTASTTTRRSGGGGGGGSSSTLPYLDSDSDGTIDSQDRCPNFNDSVDTDADGTPDGCDIIDNRDSDGDTVINTNDVCSGFDDTVDTDADSTPDGCDPVDNGDSDSDGVINAEDICSGFDDTVDSDADGIPDGCDTSLYSYELCADNLYHGWNISYCEEDSITGTDFDLLADGVYQDITGGIYMYTQTLEFQNQGTGQFLFTQDDDDAPLAAPYLFIDNSNVFLYNYSLIFTIPVPYDSSSEAAAETAFVGTTLDIQEKEFTITDLTLSPDGAIIELTLEDSDGITRVLRNSDEVILNGFDIDGTFGLIYSSAPGAFYGFDISYAPDTDEVYLLEGESMLDPIFNKFFITFDSIENDDYETIEFVAGSSSAEIRFMNNDGTAVDLPLAADSSYTSGEASDEPIFWGLEAPSSTVANQDGLLYLEGETCQGSSSVVDCQGAMFLVIDEDKNAHLVQITNVDINDNDMNFDDVTYGTANDDMPYTDGSLSVVSLTSAGNILILVDESAMSITFSSIGSRDSAMIITDNGATLEIVNTDTSIQTFEGLQFYEYNDGILAFDTYLGYTSRGPLNIIAAYDDSIDNSIIWNNSGISSFNSGEGSGVFDFSDENDAYQKFMTWKGTVLTYDLENQLNITIEHPTNPIYAVVMLESIDDATELTNFDTDSDGISDGAEIETYYTNPTDGDSDDDGLTDYDEIFDSSGYDTSPTDEDTDNDGMNDRFEIVYGFDPTNSDVDTNEQLDGDDDFDADGLTNAEEQEYGINPTSTDTDGDSLTDYEEVMDYGTYANDSDSDDDGMRDGFETAYDFDPLDADENGNEIIDGEDDEDDDLLPNAEEDAETTDPTMSDTDGDGLFDGDEVYTYLTDPLDFDTDDDELPDGMEILGFETDPTTADTDEDGMSDGFEVIYSFDPLIFDEDDNGVADGADDADEDGITNAEEEAQGTDPLDQTSF